MDERVVITGGGIGGLEVALRLERQGVPVTVIDPRDHTIFYPALHRILTGEPFESVCITFENVFAGREIHHVQTEVTGIDPDRRKLELADDTRSYEQAVLALGSTTSYASIDGDETPHTLRFKEDVTAVRQEFDTDEITDVVVVGGGATGIEAVAAIHAAERNADITLIEAGDHLLQQFGEHVGRRVEADFREKGITLHTGQTVDSVVADRVTLNNGESIDSDLTIWAGGVTPNPAIRDMPLEQGEDGLQVDEHLRCTGKDDVYAVGDIITYPGKVNRAFHALYEGRTVAKNIIQQQRGNALRRHSMPWDPNLIYLGDRDAIFEYRNVVHRGRVPALMRNIGVEQRYLWTRRHWL